MDVETIEAEVVALHRAFEQCFAGDPAGIERVEATLHDDHLFVGTDGSVVPRDDIVSALRSATGTECSIRVDDVELHWTRHDLACATYVEHQQRPSGTTARRSTVVLQVDADRPGGMAWLSVHETWIQ